MRYDAAMQALASEKPSLRSYGPWLVALGAALWGTENYWRYWLADRVENGVHLGLGYDAAVMVFVEHLLQLPFWIGLVLYLVPHVKQVLARIPKQAYGYMLFSGVAGSAVGTIFFTAAMRDGNPTVVTIIPNVQPVFSTLMAVLLFRDRLSRWFYVLAPLVIGAAFWTGLENPASMKAILVTTGLWKATYAYALLAVVGCWLVCAALLWVVRNRWAKAFLGILPLLLLALWIGASGHGPALQTSLAAAGLWTRPIGYAFLCAVCWGLSTVAGRGAMLYIPPLLGAAMRVLVGLVATFLIVAFDHKLTGAHLLPHAARSNLAYTAWLFLGLCTLSGGIPTLIYFAGLRRTRASIAGYFEMVQTLAGVLVSWGLLHKSLNAYQVVAGCALLGLVALLQRLQQQDEPTSPLSSS